MCTLTFLIQCGYETLQEGTGNIFFSIQDIGRPSLGEMVSRGIGSGLCNDLLVSHEISHY